MVSFSKHNQDQLQHFLAHAACLDKLSDCRPCERMHKVYMTIEEPELRSFSSCLCQQDR